MIGPQHLNIRRETWRPTLRPFGRSGRNCPLRSTSTRRLPLALLVPVWNDAWDSTACGMPHRRCSSPRRETMEDVLAGIGLHRSTSMSPRAYRGLCLWGSSHQTLLFSLILEYISHIKPHLFVCVSFPLPSGVQSAGSTPVHTLHEPPMPVNSASIQRRLIRFTDEFRMLSRP